MFSGRLSFIIISKKCLNEIRLFFSFCFLPLLLELYYTLSIGKWIQSSILWLLMSINYLFELKKRLLLHGQTLGCIIPFIYRYYL